MQVTDNQNDGLLGASVADLIELIREKDQALQQVTDFNYQLACERDLFKREADYYKQRCIKFQVDENKRHNQAVKYE